MEIQDTDKLYQKIGEFVVCFQWLESRFREIGWLIIDPERKQWPPLALREEINFELIKKVHVLFNDFMGMINSVESMNRKKDFGELVKKALQLRNYRNNLLHSACIELKAGSDVVSISGSNPRIKVNQDREYEFDTRILTTDSIEQEMSNLAKMAFEINNHYIQIIHWLPNSKKMASLYSGLAY